jgi:hypothetical protein
MRVSKLTSNTFNFYFRVVNTAQSFINGSFALQADRVVVSPAAGNKRSQSQFPPQSFIKEMNYT